MSGGGHLTTRPPPQRGNKEWGGGGRGGREQGKGEEEGHRERLTSAPNVNGDVSVNQEHHCLHGPHSNQSSASGVGGLDLTQSRVLLVTEKIGSQVLLFHISDGMQQVVKLVGLVYVYCDYSNLFCSVTRHTFVLDDQCMKDTIAGPLSKYRKK